MLTCKCSREFEKSQSLNAHQRWCSIVRGGSDNIKRKTSNGNVPKTKGKTFEEHFGDRAGTVRKNLSIAMMSSKPRTPYSDEARLNMSKAASNRKVKHVGWYDVGGIKVQGTWERNVCEYLLSNGYSLKRHQIRYDGTRHYTPDIYITELDTYIEVKGWMMERDFLKYRKFCSEHSHLSIKLLSGENYRKFLIGEVAIGDLPELKDIIRE